MSIKFGKSNRNGPLVVRMNGKTWAAVALFFVLNPLLPPPP